MKHKLLIFFIITYSVITSSVASPITTPLTDHLKEVGKGEMSWLFIDLYQATLYSSNGLYSHRQYPQALNITYQKNIDKAHLISATKKEWQKLSLQNSYQTDWLQQLNYIWPEIKKGDQLLFMVEQDGRGFFYHNDKPLGGIDNIAFSDAFLSIWLSQNTSEPSLRKQLMGEKR